MELEHERKARGQAATRRFSSSDSGGSRRLGGPSSSEAARRRHASSSSLRRFSSTVLLSMSVKMSYSFMYRAKDFCLEALACSSRRLPTTLLPRRCGGSRLRTSPLVVQWRCAEPAVSSRCSELTPLAEATRGSVEPVSPGPMLAAPAAAPRTLLLTLPPARLPSSFNDICETVAVSWAVAILASPVLLRLPRAALELLPRGCPAPDFALSAGMLSGRVGGGLVAIFSAKASAEGFLSVFRSSASGMRVLVQGDTQVVTSCRSQSSLGSESTAIFLCTCSCRCFLARASRSFRARCSNLIWLNFAKTFMLDWAFLQAAPFRDLGDRHMELLGEAQPSLASSSLAPRSRKVTPALPVGVRGDQEAGAPRFVGEDGGLGPGEATEKPSEMERLSSSASSGSSPRMAANSSSCCSRSSAPACESCAYRSTLCSVSVWLRAGPTLDFRPLLRRLSARACITWSSCVSSRGWPSASPNLSG
mmetsp:Transcript_34347/g.106915  ORF Transcript_34347/g.106915 Transcript_34347/m.106915 type:complete len:476 (-) Transcript_34347:809-2236(-)